MFAIIPLGKKGSTGFPIRAIVYTFAHGERELVALAYQAHTLDVLGMFTSVFAHLDIWHLTGNLFFFYCFARTIETQISIKGYLLAFVLFVFVTNFAFSLATKGPGWTVGLSGVVWGYMGIFLLRYPRDKIDCFVWFVVVFKIIDVPAIIFILGFLALNVAEYRHLENTGVLFRLMFWGVFTTEKPESKRKVAYAARPGRPARRY
jgi:membrane associated rhomboid family serine protease